MIKEAFRDDILGQTQNKPMTGLTGLIMLDECHWTMIKLWMTSRMPQHDGKIREVHYR